MAEMTEPTRRDFLIRMSALGVALSPPLGAIAQETLPTRTIPVSGEELPVIGLGSSKAVLEIPTEGIDPVASVVRLLLERGGRVVDTSPRSEAIDAEFGRLLTEPDLHESLFVSTKINTLGREAGVEQMRQTQRLFGRPTVDLIQVESLRDVDVHWPNLLEWKETGETRYLGATVSANARHRLMESFMRREAPDFLQVNYSVVETAAEDRLLPLAQDLGLAVLINRPFMNGGYFGLVEGKELPPWAVDFDCTSWAQFSLKYVLANPAVTCVLTETTSSEHMAENIGTAFGRLPDQTTRRRMRELVKGF